MIDRLITQIGWPVLGLCAVLLVIATPTVVAGLRFELRLSRRASRGTYEAREGWPYW